MERKTEHPILFSTPMVQAILEGRKTMTRRTHGLHYFNQKPDDYHFFKDASGGINWNHLDYLEEGGAVKFRHQLGKKLWVKETFENGCMGGYIYKADRSPLELGQYLMSGYKWKPSLFMPKAAARIWLEVTGVRVERLQDISEDDAKNEGIEFIEREDPYTLGYKLYGEHNYCDILGRKATTGTALESFQSLWESINGPESWNANPWVWVIEFKRIEKC